MINVTAILTQRFYLFSKSMKMNEEFQKVESTFITYIRIEHIDLRIFLHSRNILSMNSL